MDPGVPGSSPGAPAIYYEEAAKAAEFVPFLKKKRGVAQVAERRLWEPEVAGSSPAAPIEGLEKGPVAQLDRARDF